MELIKIETVKMWDGHYRRTYKISHYSNGYRIREGYFNRYYGRTIILERPTIVRRFFKLRFKWVELSYTYPEVHINSGVSILEYLWYQHKKQFLQK